MYKVIGITFLFLAACLARATGQCFDGETLRREVGLIRDSTRLAPSEQARALAGLEQKVSACSYKHDTVHVLFYRLAGSFYSSRKDFSNAVRCTRKAINLISRDGFSPVANLPLLISYYYRLSVLNDSLYRLVEKMEALDSCISIAVRAKFIDQKCLWALYTRMVYSFDVGDYHRCVHYSDLCESFAMEYARGINSGDAFPYVINSVLWRVNALIMLGNYAAAERLLENKADECRKKGYGNYLGEIYGLMSEILVFSGDFEKALRYYRLAFELEKKSGGSFNCKAMLNAVAHDVYLNYYKNTGKAIGYYKKALVYKVEEEAYQALSSFESLNILNRIGNAFVTRREYDSAFRYFQLAFDMIRPGITETGILNASVDEFARQRRLGYISTLIFDKAEAFHEKYKATKDVKAIREAIRIYKVADQFLERIKNEQFDLRSKLFWRSERRKLYERAIEACYSNGSFAEAFYFFERSRAVLLYDQIVQQRGLSEKDIIRQTQLRRKIINSEKQLAGINKESARALELQKMMISDRHELDLLEKRIRQMNPLYSQHFLDESDVLPGAVQSGILKGADQFVEFFDGDSAVYSMIITTHDIRVDRIDKRIFDSLASEFTSFVSDHRRLNREFTRFVNTSHSLYQLIFHQQPMLSGRIIVAPDRHYFPLEALLTTPTAPLNYLIREHAVSYTHSARFLMIDFNTGGNARAKDFMGVAPVHFLYGGLGSLGGSDLSLRKLKAVFPDGSIRLFKGASKSHFLREFGRYRIIQLYTHASDTSASGEPEIYFYDSVVAFSDIINETKPVTELIVLSACETGSGQWFRGEGVFSFNRAFASLGIPSSVTNLWAVDDRSTYRLTELFYKHLKTGLATDLALQKAKLEFIQESSKEKQLPCYWAATILAGRANSIVTDKQDNWGDWVIASLIALISIAALISLVKYTRAIYRPEYGSRSGLTGAEEPAYN